MKNLILAVEVQCFKTKLVYILGGAGYFVLGEGYVLGGVHSGRDRIPSAHRRADFLCVIFYLN